MTRRLVFALALAGVLAILPAAAARQQAAGGIEIRTDKAPRAIGPYSQAIAAGGFVFCSGQLAIDPATGKLVEGGIEAQTRRVIENLRAVLEAAGSSLDRVAKCTVYMTDLGEFAAMNKVYAEFFKSPAPARATCQVSKLALDARIEIECIAVK